MKNGKPNHGSGKTHFNRIKQRGQSWVALRDEAVRRGNWSPVKRQSKEDK